MDGVTQSYEQSADQATTVWSVGDRRIVERNGKAQAYVAVGTRPHTCQDGRVVELMEWQGNCQICGAEFVCATTMSGTPVSRNCQKHKWRRLIKAKSEGNSEVEAALEVIREKGGANEKPRGVRCVTVWGLIQAVAVVDPVVSTTHQKGVKRAKLMEVCRGKISDPKHFVMAFRKVLTALERQGFIKRDGNVLWVLKGLSDASNP